MVYQVIKDHPAKEEHHLKKNLTQSPSISLPHPQK